MSGRGPHAAPGPRAPRGPLAGTAPTDGPPAAPRAWERLHDLAGGLTRPGGRVAEPRLPVPATGSRTLALPLRLLVALDESGSLAVTDPNQQSRQALLELCDWVAAHSGEARDRIGVVRFADRAEAIAPVRAADARAVIEQQLLAGSSVGGGTRLTPAIEELCRQLRGRRERRVAVLVTDGQVAEDEQALRQLFATLRARSDAVYLIALDHDGAWTRSTQARYQQLGLTGTAVIGTLARAHLTHAIATTLMRETGLIPSRSWRWRR